jgi:plastocyanin
MPVEDSHMRLMVAGGLALAIAGCAATPGDRPPARHVLAAPLGPPAGTIFHTGTFIVTIGPGGVFTPDHAWVRPGSATRFVNVDSQPHTVTGFGGATSKSGPLPPGGTYTHNWRHPGTWTFHDTLTPDAPAFYLTDIP